MIGDCTRSFHGDEPKDETRRKPVPSLIKIDDRHRKLFTKIAQSMETEALKINKSTSAPIAKSRIVESSESTIAEKYEQLAKETCISVDETSWEMSNEEKDLTDSSEQNLLQCNMNCDTVPIISNRDSSNTINYNEDVCNDIGLFDDNQLQQIYCDEGSSGASHRAILTEGFKEDAEFTKSSFDILRDDQQYYYFEPGVETYLNSEEFSEIGNQYANENDNFDQLIRYIMFDEGTSESNEHTTACLEDFIEEAEFTESPIPNQHNDKQCDYQPEMKTYVISDESLPVLEHQYANDSVKLVQQISYITLQGSNDKIVSSKKNSSLKRSADEDWLYEPAKRGRGRPRHLKANEMFSMPKKVSEADFQIDNEDINKIRRIPTKRRTPKQNDVSCDFPNCDYKNNQSAVDLHKKSHYLFFVCGSTINGIRRHPNWLSSSDCGALNHLKKCKGLKSTDLTKQYYYSFFPTPRL